MDYTPHTTDEFSDAELITSVRAGDREAFGTLYARHSGAATRLARQFSANAAEADDVVSEAFAKVLDALLDGRGPDSAFRAYLFTTLRHTAIDHGRKDARLLFTDDLTQHERAAPGEDPVIADTENAIVARAFGSLPERWQAVLWHTQVEQESPAEVGILLGMTPNAVTSLAFRAREGLREAYLQAHLAAGAATECRTTVDRLGSWARGGLSAREQAQVDAHLDQCEHCRALAAELAQINSGLRMVLAPIVLGGLAVAYLATSSTTVAAVLIGSGAVGSGAAGSSAAGASTSTTSGAASAGSASSSAAAGGASSSAWSAPWVWTGAAAVAVAAVVAVVVALTGGGIPAESAVPPASVPVTTSAVAPSTTAPPTAAPTTLAPTTPAPTPTLDIASPAEPPVTNPPLAGPPAPITPPASTAPPPVAPSAVERSAREPSITEPPPAPTSTPPAPPLPSALLSSPVFASPTVDAAAGGTATMAFSVTNSGDQDSTPQVAAVTTPSGVTMTAAEGSLAPAAAAVRRPWRAFVTAPERDQTAPLVRCNSATCHYSVPAHSTLAVTITLAVAPDALAGNVSLTIDGVESSPVPLQVRPGLDSVVLGDSSLHLRGGSTTTNVPISAALADGVTDPGSITLPLRTGDVWFTDYLDNCQTVPGNSAAPNAAITCAARSVTGGIADFGLFAVTALPGASGSSPMAVSLPGGRNRMLSAAGPDASPITITPLAASDTITMTGPFGGVLVGGSTMRCDTAHVTRANCQSGPHHMVSMVSPQDVRVPKGANILSATLTWAMTYPQGATPAERMANLAHVVLHAGPIGCSDDCVATTIDPGAVKAPVVDADGAPRDEDRAMYMRSADVTDLISGSSTVWADGLLAVASSPLGGYTPMAGWALSVLWSDPSAESVTVTVSNPGSKCNSSTDGTCHDDDLRSTGTLVDAGPAGQLSTVFWAADPQSVKEIVAGKDVLATSPIWGVEPDDSGSFDNGFATGFDLITGVKAPADRPVVLRNTYESTPPGYWEQSSDTLWIGPTLVIRDSA